MINSISTIPRKILRRLGFFRSPDRISESKLVKPDFRGVLAREYPNENLTAWETTNNILSIVEGTDLDALALHSPALKGFDWSSYLQLSTIRMARTLHALRIQGVYSGRIADIGSYFGNFSLLFSQNGYEVTAVDSYSQYGSTLQPVINLLKSNGVAVRDFSELGTSLEKLPPESFDVVISMGVIEHIPHTPRLFLEAVNRILRPGGLLIIDTPNLGYLYTREKLSRGESIFCPLELQYETALPFEGHHREYTQQELLWMLKRIDHELLDLQMFNYSMCGLSEISGADAEKWRAMEKDASLRELILTVSRKN